ncbi:double-strand break repair helicase AddA [Elioraea sp.]|uniref:double-strand break repair helicase AddA n=1 Tax=Elioraea sp. TaxID=2185103 RepID=UPI003F70BC28
MSAPTPEQRKAADPRASSWVSASAGSGKTRLLVDRVLRLMLAGNDPAHILCLTFTRAAAAEMATRLQARLGDWATLPDAALDAEIEALAGARPDKDTRDRARALFARVLDLPGGMKIATIHAFCQGLLRRFPLEARIPPQFALVEEAEARGLLEQARESALAEAPLTQAGEQAVARLAALTDPGRLGEAIRAVLPARGRPGLAAIGNSPDGVAAAQRRVLGLDIDDTEASVLAAACDPPAAVTDALARLAAAWIGANGAQEESGHGVRAWLAADAAARAARWDAYRLLFLTTTGAPRAEKTVAPRTVQSLCADAFAIASAEAERVLEVDRRLRAVRLAEASAALARVGLPVIERYRAAKDARAALDYDDLIARARRLLETQGAVEWVHYKLDAGLDHVLLDEAQDTNPDQWAVVGALTEEFFTGLGARPGPRTMFAVGDDKQSIYGFQGADPRAFVDWKSVFERRAHDARARWQPESLTLSFRSVAPVLALTDAVFAGDAGRGVSLAGRTIAHRAAREGHAGSVELWPLVSGSEVPEPEAWDPVTEAVDLPDPAQRLAVAIARRIKSWIGREELPARARRIRAGDVMILVRRRDAFVAKLVRELKREQVAVAGLDRLTLADSLPVQDILALCRTAVQPEDDLSLAEVLRGPFCDVDEESLFALARDRDDVARLRPSTLWSALRDRRAERREWEHAASLIEEIAARADYDRPYDVLAHLLGEKRGRWRLRRRLGPDAADPIEELLAQALHYEQLAPPSMQGFIHWIERSGLEVKREQEGAGDAVRVMTVHAAKGLQAPIVILPDTVRPPPMQDTVLWATDTIDDAHLVPLWAPRAALRDPVFDDLLAAEKTHQDAEYRRLLYVALTRAEDRLIVCGWYGVRGPGNGSWYRLVEAGFRALPDAAPFPFDSRGSDWAGAQGWEGEGWRLEAPQERPPAPDRREAEPPALIRPPLWAETQAPAEAPSPRPIRPSREDGEEPPVAPPVAAGDRGGRRFRRGIIVHALLQHLPDRPPADRRAAAQRFLAGQEVTPGEAAAIAAETLAILDDPAFAPLFTPGSLAEAPIIGRIGARAVNGTVDRLAVTDEAVLIADYKTNRPPPERVEDVAPLYLRQMAAYRAVLRAVFPGHPVRCALVWTYAGRLMPLPDRALDAHAPDAGEG